MKFSSFEIFQIKWLISDKINELRNDWIKEKDFKLKAEFEEIIREYEEMIIKINDWYEKTLLDEIN